MDNEYAADLITLLDDDDNEHTFEILDIIENEDGVYYALYPIFDSPEEQVESDGEYYIFEAVDDDGEEVLTEVEDEELLDKLAEVFENHFEELYDESAPEDEYL